MSGELPEGWEHHKVSDITLKVGSGATPKGGGESYKKSGIPLIRSMNVVFFGFKYEGIVFLDDNQADELKNVEVCQDDILLNITGASIGRVTTAPKDMHRARVNQHVCIIRPFNFVDYKYLCFYLSSPEMQDFINLENYGVTRQALTKQQILDLNVPLPPGLEQKRIVAKVEELLGKVKVARDLLSTIPNILQRFRQSVLASACSGKLTEGLKPAATTNHFPSWFSQTFGPDAITSSNPEDPFTLPQLPDRWIYARTESLCQPDRKITYGVIKLGEHLENGVPILRSSDVRWLKLDLNDMKKISSEIAQDYKRTFLSGGEILVTVRGTLGGVAVVPEDLAGYNISREVAMLAINQELNPKFFSYAIASPFSQRWLAEVSKGVAYTGINIRDLKLLPLPVPPIDEQNEIVRRVEALFALADKIEERVTDALARVEKTTQAILAKAFRGELVPTEAELARREGRDYEPASVLLATIRAEGNGEKPARKVAAGRKAKTAPEPAQKIRDFSAPASPSSTSIPQRILDAMHPSREYSRADILAAAKITEAEWLWAVKQLKDSGSIEQIGEKRGARYRRTGAAQ